MKYEYYNPNPTASFFNSGKPKHWTKDDSAIRAICKATNKSWETVFNELCKIAKSEYDIITSKNVISTYCLINNFNHITYGKPIHGEKRLTLEDFINQHPQGTYIIYKANYFICVKDGVYYDVQQDDNKAVYSYWEIK